MPTPCRPLPALLFLATVASTFAADAPAPAATAPAPAVPTPKEVVELSPFTVSTDKDRGYYAENTLAGSRLNSQLRDTASSISVFTREFLNDLAITDISELLQYSVNGEIDTAANRSNVEQNPFVNAERLNARILIRGLAASEGMDYFTSITPSDPYRVGRYEDSRGPNSIIYGIGSPGGLVNQSSKTAHLRRDEAQLSYSFGSWERNRAELDVNKVLVKQKLALSLAAVDQENGGWRAFDYQDKERIFGSVTVRPVSALTVTLMGETGRNLGAVMRSTTESDEALAWYDNRQAFGLNAVTFTPNNTLPTTAMQAVGVTTRDGQRTGNNRRAIFIENDGTVFDNIGAFLTGSYSNAAVRAPDGTPGVTSTVLRLNDERLFPRDMNAAGPGMYRAQSLKNYTITADYQPTRALAINVAHNFQDTTAVVTLMTGTDPTLRGDPNRTLGVNGPVNPWAGRLYFDGNWRRDTHSGRSKETRLSASYTLEPRWKWLGRHRVAGMVSRTEQLDLRYNSWLSLAGRPFNPVPNNVNNRITVRNYITEGQVGTYRVGDWRSLPTTVNFGGQNYGLVFAREVAGANNSGGEQESDSMLGVVQSHFLEGKLVTTFGYRQDNVDVFEFGYTSDPLVGDVIDRDRSKASVTSATGRTATAGGVYHVFNWLSLVANRSSNQGVPSFVRKVFPDGRLAPSSKGEGEDYGLSFDLLGGRLNAKVVYFTATEQGRVDTVGFGGAAGRNTRVMDAFASALVGPGLPYTTSSWDPLYRSLTPPATASTSDYESEGYEARVVANLTSNWRLVANYSYTDSGLTNLSRELAAWYGLKPVDDVRVQQGVSQDASGRFIVNPAAFETGGAVARWIELSRQNPAADLSTLTTSNSQTIAQEIFNLVDTLNQNREDQQKRWGVRPHKISLFTAYDFRTGRLKGFTVGGGWRWRSANIIGSNSAGAEITGKDLTAADLMLGYNLKLPRVPGRFRIQLNVSNLFDDTDIIPVRLATGATAPDGYSVPGGRGVAYSRFDLVAPREFRFTTSWTF